MKAGHSPTVWPFSRFLVLLISSTNSIVYTCTSEQYQTNMLFQSSEHFSYKGITHHVNSSHVILINNNIKQGQGTMLNGATFYANMLSCCCAIAHFISDMVYVTG